MEDYPQLFHVCLTKTWIRARKGYSWNSGEDFDLSHIRDDVETTVKAKINEHGKEDTGQKGLAQRLARSHFENISSEIVAAWLIFHDTIFLLAILSWSEQVKSPQKIKHSESECCKLGHLVDSKALDKQSVRVGGWKPQLSWLGSDRETQVAWWVQWICFAM